MFGDKFNLGNIASLMKNANKIQDMMKEAQAKLAKVEVTGEAGGGLVKIVMTADNCAKSVWIDDSLLSEEKTVLQDLIAAAINDGAQKTQKVKEQLLDQNNILNSIMDDKS